MRPILTMPCSCHAPEECCWEDRMLAFQYLLQDERTYGHDFNAYVRSTNDAVAMESKYVTALVRKYDQDTEAKGRARLAATTKIWWIPYYKRPNHPTPYHWNSPLPTPIPGPEDIYPHASVFVPTPEGYTTNGKKRRREQCVCEECRRPKTHRSVKTQTYESSLSPAWHVEEGQPTELNEGGV